MCVHGETIEKVQTYVLRYEMLMTRATPANRRQWPSVVLMLGHRRRRWPNITTTLGYFLVYLPRHQSLGQQREVNARRVHDTVKVNMLEWAVPDQKRANVPYVGRALHQHWATSGFIVLAEIWATVCCLAPKITNSYLEYFQPCFVTLF